MDPISETVQETGTMTWAASLLRLPHDMTIAEIEIKFGSDWKVPSVQLRPMKNQQFRILQTVNIRGISPTEPILYRNLLGQ